MDNTLLIGKGDTQQWLPAQYANRHGVPGSLTRR